MKSQKETLKTTDPVAVLQTGQDLKDALLIVSIVINLFMFTAWLVVQVDPTVALALVQSN